MEEGATLVFVEVKTRLQDDSFGEPEESITSRKQRHIIKSALGYLMMTGWEDRAIRFDVVTLSPAGLRHHRDAFQYEGDVYF